MFRSESIRVQVLRRADALFMVRRTLSDIGLSFFSGLTTHIVVEEVTDLHVPLTFPGLLKSFQTFFIDACTPSSSRLKASPWSLVNFARRCALRAFWGLRYMVTSAGQRWDLGRSRCPTQCSHLIGHRHPLYRYELREDILLTDVAGTAG